MAVLTVWPNRQTCFLTRLYRGSCGESESESFSKHVGFGFRSARGIQDSGSTPNSKSKTKPKLSMLSLLRNQVHTWTNTQNPDAARFDAESFPFHAEQCHNQQPSLDLWEATPVSPRINESILATSYTSVAESTTVPPIHNPPLAANAHTSTNQCKRCSSSSPPRCLGAASMSMPADSGLLLTQTATRCSIRRRFWEATPFCQRDPESVRSEGLDFGKPRPFGYPESVRSEVRRP